MIIISVLALCRVISSAPNIPCFLHPRFSLTEGRPDLLIWAVERKVHQVPSALLGDTQIPTLGLKHQSVVDVL